MNKRIGLFTPIQKTKKRGGPTTTMTYVDTNTAADLAEKLTKLGAKRIGLLRRDRVGTTHLEGSMFAVGDLKEEHLDWVVAKAPEFETRGIFYDVK